MCKNFDNYYTRLTKVFQTQLNGRTIITYYHLFRSSCSILEKWTGQLTDFYHDICFVLIVIFTVDSNKPNSVMKIVPLFTLDFKPVSGETCPGSPYGQEVRQKL